jgi:hypothetical protein
MCISLRNACFAMAENFFEDCCFQIFSVSASRNALIMDLLRVEPRDQVYQVHAVPPLKATPPARDAMVRVRALRVAGCAQRDAGVI